MAKQRNGQENVTAIGDLKLTGLHGEKLLVNAFDIALVREENENRTVLTLKVPVGGGGDTTRFRFGLEVEVREGRDEIAEMRAQLQPR